MGDALGLNMFVRICLLGMYVRGGVFQAKAADGVPRKLRIALYSVFYDHYVGGTNRGYA